jgi:ornithine decarboxylase
VQAGAIPIFLPTARNSFGMIGAVDWDAWDEKTLRERIRNHPRIKDKKRADSERPFRLACIQLCTYDGTVYNVRKVMEKLGPPVRLRAVGRGLDRLQRLPPAVRGHSPMRLQKLTPDMPGLFSTQSVHKQGAGFSQASQIHKRDEHIKGQKRFIEHKRFNESFLLNASTSPFYPLFASLDVNAKIHEGKAGEMMWDRCIELGIEARKKLREFGQRYAEARARRAGEVVLRPVRAGRGQHQGLEVHQGRHQRSLGEPAHRRAQARTAVLGVRPEESLARLFGLRRRLCHGRSRTSSCC